MRFSGSGPIELRRRSEDSRRGLVRLRRGAGWLPLETVGVLERIAFAANEFDMLDGLERMKKLIDGL